MSTWQQQEDVEEMMRQYADGIRARFEGMRKATTEAEGYPDAEGLAALRSASEPIRTVIQITPEAIQREYELRNGTTSTNDEREAMAQWLHTRFGHIRDESFPWESLTERRRTAWRDLAADAPLRPQGEPSDAQELLDEADALVESWDRKGSWSSDSPVGLVMRLSRALRAAGGVR